jgi:plastocyanin
MQVVRRGGWSASGTSLALILAACTGSPLVAGPTDPNTGVSAATARTSEAPATAAPAPEFSSSTERATAAPEGAVIVELAGPPGHFEPRMLTAKAGDVVFYLANTSPGAHSMAIDRVAITFNGDRVANVPLVVSNVVQRQTSAIFAVDGLSAGTYFFWCTVDNHAAEGMTGSMIVTP